MQCYESEALMLQVFSDARLFSPETEPDPLVVDEVLDDFQVHDFLEYRALSPDRRVELVRRVTHLSGNGTRTARTLVA